MALACVEIRRGQNDTVFSANDQSVSRFYDNGSSTPLATTNEFGAPRYMEYGVVPSSTTQTDQIKISANLNDTNKIYSFLLAGNTHKESDIVSPTAPAASRNPPLWSLRKRCGAWA